MIRLDFDTYTSLWSYCSLELINYRKLRDKLGTKWIKSKKIHQVFQSITTFQLASLLSNSYQNLDFFDRIADPNPHCYDIIRRIAQNNLLISNIERDTRAILVSNS